MLVMKDYQWVAIQKLHIYNNKQQYFLLLIILKQLKIKNIKYKK